MIFEKKEVSGKTKIKKIISHLRSVNFLSRKLVKRRHCPKSDCRGQSLETSPFARTFGVEQSRVSNCRRPEEERRRRRRQAPRRAFRDHHGVYHRSAQTPKQAFTTFMNGSY